MPLVHHVRCTLSIHTCTALNCIPVLHLHTTDMVIRVTVSSHRFHCRSPISICLPHCATIWMCEICGASWLMHVINPHMHCSKLHPCPALAHHRYSNDSNSTFTPVSLSVTHSHLLATLHHDSCIYYSQCHFIWNSEMPSQTLTYANSRWTVMVFKCGMHVLLHKHMVAKSVMHVLHHVWSILSTHTFMTVNYIPVRCVQIIVIIIKVPSAGFYRSNVAVIWVIHVMPHVGCM